MKSRFIYKLILIIGNFTVVCLSACKHKTDQEAIRRFCENQLPDWNGKLTQVIIADIFTPAICSRIYAYANIAAYEAVRPGYKSYSFAGKLRGLEPVPQPVPGKVYCYPISGVIAFSTVAQKLVFNGDAVAAMEKDFIRQLSDSLNISGELLSNSIAYGRLVGSHILKWAGKDGYLERNSLPGYIVTQEPGRYQPTPPGYADAMEPNWKTVRPFLLDSASQFRPPPPTRFDTSKESPFYKEAYQVYHAGKYPEQGDSATAWYWDDNPNTSITNGHVTYFQQKNSPPGHWMHIACSIAEKEKMDAMQTASLLCKVAIAVADAFISAWDAKYVYNYIRPETFITRYIDKDWVPLIQTPPFPEYPSAHSVASSSAATVLTKIIGDHYTFIDSTEVPYGRPTRMFHSFYEAADQASISRLYGGIHFITAIEKGKEQGRKIGGFVLAKLGQ